MFECRFSMDGLSFAATDALGHLILFGFGDDQPYQKVRECVVSYYCIVGTTKVWVWPVKKNITQKPASLLPDDNEAVLGR